MTSFTALLMVALVAGAAPEGATGSSGPVERVIVFADRAEVTRVTTAKCSDGAAVFGGLPESIDPRTLRGEAEGDAEAVGVQSSRTALEESRDERVKALTQEVQDYDDQLAVLARADADDAERARTNESYAAYFRALAVEEMRDAKPEQGRWDQMLNAVTADRASLASARLARAVERRALDRKRDRAMARLSRMQPAASPSVLVATVALKCASASASVKVRLSYVVPGATWLPEYDVRYANGKAAITVAGVVTQSTGEDWSDAEVWLSTAKPNLGGDAPMPNPLYVSGYEEQKQKTLVQGQEHRAEDLQTGKNQVAVAVQGASLEDGGKSFVLKLPKRVTVRADGRPYWFPVDEVSTTAKASLVVEPALSPYAYQVASLSNPAPYPLMAGRVHVFRGATYVGDVDTEYKAPGEPMEVSLGLDEQIAFERQDLLKQKREAGLLSHNQSIAHAYRTVLKNRSEGDVVVEVREQIPVSKSADINVKIEDDKTAPGYKLDKLRGHLTWIVPLKKGAEENRDIAFTIALPKDWQVQ